MKILISTGIYPPDIGGPAQYARSLYETWKKEGHEVKVAAYRWERAFPPLVRHILFLLKIIRKGWNADLILVLDTWSAAVPTMAACVLMRKKYIIRTGGDFLWESYVERTGDMVLFKDFYNKSRDKFSKKEKLTFNLTRKALKNAKSLIFSTEWQRGIFEKAYGLNTKKDFIVENHCAPHMPVIEPDSMTFVAGTRTLKWKNVDALKHAFEAAKKEVKAHSLQDIELDTGKAVYDSFVEKIRRSYAVVLASIGDISPNMIFDAISAGTPFILTKETGIYDRVKDCAIFVDPLDRSDIAEKIVWLSDKHNWEMQRQKVRSFQFTHSWEDIAKEIVSISKKK